MRVVLADAGPLIGLARIERLQLLRALFATVWITDVIAAELGLTAAGDNPPSLPGTVLLQEACDQGWLRVARPCTLPWTPLNPGVDAGEASAIGAALQRRASGDEVLLVIDDRCGRAEARCQGLAVIGTAAVLVLAKEQGLVRACGPLLLALREEGYYLGDGLIAAVLRQVGETHRTP
jgi:predicted nucleic acid-binding protein